MGTDQDEDGVDSDNEEQDEAEENEREKEARSVSCKNSLDNATHQSSLVRRLGVLFGRADYEVETGRLYVLEVGKDSCLNLVNSSLDNLL